MHNIKRSHQLLWAFIFLIGFTFAGYGQQGTEDTARKNYKQAKKNFDANPSEENTIWLGRRTAYLGKCTKD
jgi:hypothetical protein